MLEGRSHRSRMSIKSGVCEIQITPPLPCCIKTTELHHKLSWQLAANPRGHFAMDLPAAHKEQEYQSLVRLVPYPRSDASYLIKVITAMANSGGGRSSSAATTTARLQVSTRQLCSALPPTLSTRSQVHRKAVPIATHPDICRQTPALSEGSAIRVAGISRGRDRRMRPGRLLAVQRAGISHECSRPGSVVTGGGRRVGGAHAQIARGWDFLRGRLVLYVIPSGEEETRRSSDL